MGTVSFPVVFYDGETETSIGNVVVYPSTTDFKSFQSTLSHKIGISSHQFTVYLADRNKPARFSRRIPITAKSNFSSISRHSNDSLFLVVLKRSRRDRRRIIHNTTTTTTTSQLKWDPHQKLTLLRRNNNNNNVTHTSYDDEVFAGLVSMGFNGLSLGPPDDSERELRRSVDVYGTYGGLVCEECLRAKERGRGVGFHWCVYDAVTFGFRSPAGPIARPTKGSD